MSDSAVSNPILSSPFVQKLDQELKSFTARGTLDLRRWLVERIILSKETQSVLPQLDPPESMVNAALEGIGPSPEHCGIAARLLYDQMGRKSLILHNMPRIESPKSWNQPESMTMLLLWAFEPWNTFRYDPKSETVQVAMDSGQWAFHLKGRDTEDTIGLQIQNMLSRLRAIGFETILSHLVDQGFATLNPQEAGVDAQSYAIALNASANAFDKFLSRNVTNDIFGQIRKLPIMYFDTSTVNSVRNLAAFGNGVVPTADIREVTDEYDMITYPAGLLIPAHKEFVLSSAAGLAWPNDAMFDDLMNHRVAIHAGHEDDWDDWMMAAGTYADLLLEHRCPTYLSFLNHAFPLKDGVPEERDAFLRLLGAAVFGTNLKIIAAFIGAPNAGKDTVIKWLSMIMGDGQVGVLSPLALTSQSDDQRALAPLKGAKIAVVSGEVGEGRNTAILAEKVKSITSGGGTLTVAEKYEKPTTIFFDGMLIMQGNSVPTIQGGDKALYKNRLVAVEFKHPFELTADSSWDRMYRKEAPYFLQVLFLSYLDYMERGGGLQGIAPPESWQQFGEDVEFSADALAVLDRCIEYDPDLEIPSTIFYRALSILAERSLGLKYPISAQRWAARLKRAGVDLSRNAPTKWRSRVNRQDFNGWMMHFTLNADNSDGFFTQQDWTNALQAATVGSNA